MATGDPIVQIMDLPPHDLVPAWVADLAEVTASQVKYKMEQQQDIERLRLLRTQLLASKSTDPWAAFGRWYFAESGVRSISPWSTVSLEQYVQFLIELGDKDSLEYARTLSFDHPTWMVKIVPLLTKSGSAPETGAKH